MYLKIDFHCHSLYSKHNFWKTEAFGSPRQMIDMARKRGLNGLAITDHDSVKGSLEGMKYAKNLKDFLLVTGSEVSSDGGHIVALGIRKNIPKGLSVGETVDRIHDQGGLAIAAHPYGSWPRKDVLRDKIKNQKFDAIEILNGGLTIKGNRKAYESAGEMKLPMTAGSDSHHWKDLGKIYNILECEPNLDSLFREIKKGRIQIVGRPFGFYSGARLVTRKIQYLIKNRI